GGVAGAGRGVAGAAGAGRAARPAGAGLGRPRLVESALVGGDPRPRVASAAAPPRRRLLSARRPAPPARGGARAGSGSRLGGCRRRLPARAAAAARHPGRDVGGGSDRAVAAADRSGADRGRPLLVWPARLDRTRLSDREVARLALG